MLTFEPGWDVGSNNNTPNKLSKEHLEEAILEAMPKLKDRTTDADFRFLYTTVTSTEAMLKGKVVKGMHQESGSQIVPESHCTIEVPDWPPKRYHIWFMWLTQKKKAGGWVSSRVSYEHAPRQYTNVDII